MNRYKLKNEIMISILTAQETVDVFLDPECHELEFDGSTIWVINTKSGARAESADCGWVIPEHVKRGNIVELP